MDITDLPSIFDVTKFNFITYPPIAFGFLALINFSTFWLAILALAIILSSIGGFHINQTVERAKISLARERASGRRKNPTLLWAMRLAIDWKHTKGKILLVVYGALIILSVSGFILTIFNLPKLQTSGLAQDSTVILFSEGVFVLSSTLYLILTHPREFGLERARFLRHWLRRRS